MRQLVVGAALLISASVSSRSEETSLPKLSKIEVDAIIANIKNDPVKMQSYCTIVKLSDEYNKAGEENDSKRLRELSDQLEKASEQAGPELGKLLTSEIEEESERAIDDLAAEC